MNEEIQATPKADDTLVTASPAPAQAAVHAAPKGSKKPAPQATQVALLTRDNAIADSRDAAPPANGLYRCQGPNGVLYQSEPCPSGTKQAAVAGGTMSVVSTPPVAVTQYSAPSTRDEGKSVGLIARTPAKASGNESACEQHEESIKQIDAASRIGGTSWKMERLREERRYRTDSMWRLGCGR
jgi:hypothetical protein